MLNKGVNKSKVKQIYMKTEKNIPNLNFMSKNSSTVSR